MWVIEIEIGGGKGESRERKRSWKPQSVLHQLPCIPKKNSCQCLNVSILRCFIIPLFPTKAQRLIRSLLLMQFIIQNTPFLNLVFMASVTTLYIFPQDKVYVSNYQLIIFPDEEHLWLIILFSPLEFLNFIAIV